MEDMDGPPNGFGACMSWGECKDVICASKMGGRKKVLSSWHTDLSLLLLLQQLLLVIAHHGLRDTGGVLEGHLAPHTLVHGVW